MTVFLKHIEGMELVGINSLESLRIKITIKSSITYMLYLEDIDKCGYLMKNSLQTVSGFYLKTSVKAAGTMPLTSLGPKYHPLASNDFKLTYTPEGLPAWTLPLKPQEVNWRSQLN